MSRGVDVGASSDEGAKRVGFPYNSHSTEGSVKECPEVLWGGRRGGGVPGSCRPL
jgi:hypothetical protein